MIRLNQARESIMLVRPMASRMFGTVTERLHQLRGIGRDFKLRNLPALHDD